MKMQATLTIITVDRWKMDDGNSAGRVYVLDDNPTTSPNAVGRPVLEFATDYDQLDNLRQYNDKFPAKFDCEFETKQGAKKKVTNHITSFKLSSSASSNSK